MGYTNSKINLPKRNFDCVIAISCFNLLRLCYRNVYCDSDIKDDSWNSILSLILNIFVTSCLLS